MEKLDIHTFKNTIAPYVYFEPGKPIKKYVLPSLCKHVDNSLDVIYDLDDFNDIRIRAGKNLFRYHTFFLTDIFFLTS